MIRTTIAKAKIESGQEILQEGHRVARYLWNELWWCAVGHNRKLARARGHKSLAGRLPRYPGKFGMDAATRDYWAFQNLSDRCATYTLSDFDIAMRSWFSNLKQNPDARPPRPLKRDARRPLRFEPGRNAKHLGDWRFKLTVLGGHISERHATVKVRICPGIKVSQVKLIQIDPGGRAIVMYEKPAAVQQGQKFAAIDQGIINAACVFFDNGESILYSGKGILASDQRYAKKTAKCKPRNYPKHNTDRPKPSNRQLAYQAKAKHRHQRMVHNITRSIIDQCRARSVGTIIIGDLRGIRKDKDWGKKSNQWLHRWPFTEFLRQVEYKAEEVGIEVVKINERGTSSACPFCGSLGVTRNPRGLLKCRDCGVAVNSDLAGAMNILQKYLPGFSLGVEAVLSSLRQTPLGRESANHVPRISPAFVAKFDLRGLQLEIKRCGAPIAT
jgi:putative transposase